jgi:hypothetical protein
MMGFEQKKHATITEHDLQKRRKVKGDVCFREGYKIFRLFYESLGTTTEAGI